MIWCKYQGFKMVLANLQLISKKYKICKRKCSKTILKKSLTTFFVSRAEGHLKERTFIGGCTIFKLLAVLSVAKLYTHGITFSVIWNLLVTWILIYKILFFVNWRTHRIMFYFSCQTVTVISEIIFCKPTNWNSYINW